MLAPRLFAAGALLAALLGPSGATAQSSDPSPAPRDLPPIAGWPQFLHDAAHTGATTAETTITPKNVDRLALAWWAPSGFNGSPSVADGVVYIGAGDGTPDLTLVAPRPDFRTVPTQSHMGTSTMVHRVDGRWHGTIVRSNILSFAQRLFPRDVTLTRHGGPMSELLTGLGASTMLRLDVVRDAQIVLNMPMPLGELDGAPR